MYVYTYMLFCIYNLVTQMQMLWDPEPVSMPPQYVNWREEFQEQENEPGSWGKATGLKGVHPPNKSKQSLSRARHKDYLFFQAVAQAPLLCKRDNDAATESSFVRWCENLYVDVKYHYAITCGPQVWSLICTVSNVVFPHFAAEWKLKKQYAVIIITVNPFGVCHISSSSRFTYLSV